MRTHSLEMLLLAVSAALGACAMPAVSGTGNRATSLATLDTAACLEPVAARSLLPIIRDARLRLENNMVVLTGCVINPGPNVYSELALQFAFFDAEGHFLNSVGEEAANLPPYSAPPASAAGLPRWMQSFDVQSYPSATRAEILLRVFLCSPENRACSQEQQIAVVRRTGA